MRNSFIVHIDSLCVLEDLTNEQRGELFYAIYCYQINKEIELSPIVKIAFSQFKNQFLRDEEKYKKTCEARKYSGSLGGKQKVANASNCNQKVANLADSDSKSKNKSKNKSNSDSKSNNDSNEVIDGGITTTLDKGVDKGVTNNANEKEKGKEKVKDKEEILEVVNSSSGLNKESFVEWLEYKKFKYQINSINKLIEMLTQYDFYTQKEIIDNSIMNNYKGLFEPKKKTSSSMSLYDKNKQHMEDFMRRINQQEILDSEVM